MPQAILACIGTVTLAACAAPPYQGEPQQVPAVHLGNTAAAETRPTAELIYPERSSYPAPPEVLAFQNYGHVIADRVSSDPNFGGFVFKNEPEPHAIVMFTGDAEARLRRYTRDPRFKAKRVDLTLAELERMKEATTNQLMALQLECWTSDADEEHNVVTVTTPEVEKVRQAITDGRFKPPHKFRVLHGTCPTWRPAEQSSHAVEARPSPATPPPRLNWELLPPLPPVPPPQTGNQSEPPAGDALGDVWEEDEENMWRGVWIRRTQSRLFDAYWVHPSGERVLAVVEIISRGREVEIRRRHPDGQGCTYRGTIAANWVDVGGWYNCSWHRHTSPWRAKIIRMRDVSPALLSNGGWRRSQ